MWMKKLKFIAPIFIILLMFSGCSSKENEKTFEQKMREVYKKNNREDKFNEIMKEYDGNKIILWLNSDEDRSWLTNHIIYWLSWILPDPPTILATGGILAFIYGLAWWLGLVLTGGGILALLAYIGSLFGGIPGIPPALAGIVYLGILFSILLKIFSLLF